LVSQGFDVTVPTVGFRTSAEGTAELACVAAATGAEAYEAGDSAELDEALAGIVRPEVSLDVRFDSAPLAGGSMTITARVQHVRGRAASGVRMTLVFGESDGGTRRAGIPPQVRLGELGDGASGYYSWSVGTGARGEVSTVPFIVRVWGTNLPVKQFSGEYTTQPPLAEGADLGAVFAGVDDAHPLAVFGDSYSSGEGTGAYIDTPAGVSDSCHRSAATTMGSVLPDGEMLIVACSGAVVNDLTQYSSRAESSQVAQFERLGIVPGAAVLTFGGNDIGFASIVARCISPFSDCDDQDMLEGKVSEVRDLQNTLETAYEVAWSELNTPAFVTARSGAHAPLVVLPYPKVVHRPEYGACYQFDHGEVIVAEVLTRELNAVIARAVADVRKEGFYVYFAEPVADAMRPDHTLCEQGDEAFVNVWIVAGPPSFADPESVHPNSSGY